MSISKVRMHELSLWIFCIFSTPSCDRRNILWASFDITAFCEHELDNLCLTNNEKKYINR